jgi:hypothetical protein
MMELINLSETQMDEENKCLQSQMMKVDNFSIDLDNEENVVMIEKAKVDTIKTYLKIEDRIRSLN